MATPSTCPIDLPANTPGLTDADTADLSDLEDAESLDLSKFKVDWLDLSVVGCDKKLGISALPGCRYKDTWRCLRVDISWLKEDGIEDIFCFCTNSELYKYRAKNLVQKYTEAGFTVHHRPIDDGAVLSVTEMVGLIDEIRDCLLSGRKTLLHCHQGIGRSCAVAACLMMSLDQNFHQSKAVDYVRELKGHCAVYSIKQYNFVVEYEEKVRALKLEDKRDDKTEEPVRSVSR